jgi:hypothetical protein
MNEFNISMPINPYNKEISLYNAASCAYKPSEMRNMTPIAFDYVPEMPKQRLYGSLKDIVMSAFARKSGNTARRAVAVNG